MASVAQDPRYQVSGDERAQVVDAVNRLNMAFDEWEVETMVAAFTEDGAVHHARGEIRGYDALRIFYEGYRPLTLGVRRQALNHVVDKLPDGQLRVTSYNLLIRVGPPADHDKLHEQMVSEYDGAFPGLFLHARTIDTFRKDEGHSWRITSRSADRNAVNRQLNERAFA